MIDFHNHILPNIDDGAKSVEISIEMLKTAQEQGITDVVSTVHYQHPKMDGKNTDFQFIKHEADKLQKISIGKIDMNSKASSKSEDQEAFRQNGLHQQIMAPISPYTQQPTKSDKLSCKSCGFDLPGEFSFCPGCGAKI